MTEINLKRAPFSNGNGAATSATSAALTERCQQAVDIQPRDWDCLFAAVIERLQVTVSAQFAAEHDANASVTLAAVTSSVRECLEALAQLQASIVYERDRPAAIDADIAREKVLLAEALAQLSARNAATQQRAMGERRLLLHDSPAGSQNGCGLAIG